MDGAGKFPQGLLNIQADEPRWPKDNKGENCLGLTGAGEGLPRACSSLTLTTASYLSLSLGK